MITRIASLAALVGCLGCGGAAAESPAPLAPAKPAASVALEVPEPDLTPVAAPPDLIVVGRVARPRLLIETLATWLGMPVQVDKALPNELAELGQALAWDAPVELASVMDPRSTNARAVPPLIVVSVGLTSLDKALEVAQARANGVTEVSPGVYRVGLPSKGTCALAASLGASPARLVCGESWRDVETLLPYATRGLPTQDLGSDALHLEINAEPIRRTFDKDIGRLRAYAGLALGMLTLDDARFDRVLTDVAYGLADELKALAGEVSTLTFSARLDADKKALAFRQSLAFHLPAGVTAASFSARLLEELGRRKAPPPDVFWELPAEGANGGYATWADPARVGEILKDLIELGDAYLEHEKVAPSVRRRARKALETYAALSTSGAYVGGPPVSKAGAAPGLIGWSVGASVERADKLTGLFGEVKALLADKELAKVLAERLQIDAKLLPKIQSQIVTVKGYPARATAYQVDFPRALVEKLELLGRPVRAGASAPPAKSQALSFIVVPDGERSLIAYAPEQKRALALLEGLKSSASPKLASVPALQSLKTSPSVWGGYWTLESFLPQLSKVVNGGADPLAHMPNHGRTPCLLRVDVVANAPSLTLVFEGELPQGVFEDVGSVAPEFAGSLLR